MCYAFYQVKYGFHPVVQFWFVFAFTFTSMKINFKIYHLMKTIIVRTVIGVLFLSGAITTQHHLTIREQTILKKNY